MVDNIPEFSDFHEVECSVCNGTGLITSNAYQDYMDIHHLDPVSSVEYSLDNVQEHCENCHGTGLITKEKVKPII